MVSLHIAVSESKCCHINVHRAKSSRNLHFFFLHRIKSLSYPTTTFINSLWGKTDKQTRNNSTVQNLLKSRICCCSYSVAKSHLTLCNPMDCSTPGSSVLHYLPEFAQSHEHWVTDTILTISFSAAPSPLAFHLSQHQGLFQWVGSSHQVAKVLELQPQLQWTFYALVYFF